MKRVFKVVKGIISYILALALTVVFALFLNARVGWFMLIALILAPLLSVFFAFLTQKTLKYTFEMEDVRLSKGEYCELKVKLYNRSIFPSSFIEIAVQNGDGVFCEDKGIITTLMPFTTKEITLRFKGEICGKSYIGIKEIRISDFLGIINLYVDGNTELTMKLLKKLMKDEMDFVDESNYTGKICVIPEIKKVSPKDDRILKIMQESMNSSDGEDTKESVFNNFSGFPGYDKREYVPGDPIKRINWKQSMKRNKLLVRLDDEINSNGVNIVLDGYFNKNSIPEGLNAPLIAQYAVENALGIINTLVSCDYYVHFFVLMDEEFIKYDIEDEKDVEALRINMSEFGFSDMQSKRFPEEFFNDEDAFVLVTPNGSGQINLRQNVSVFSAMDEMEADNWGKSAFEETSAIKKKSFKEKAISILKEQSIAYILASVLSIIVFDAFNVKVVSFWTVLQLIVVALLFLLCNFARKHKLLGFLAVSITVVASLFMAGSLITPASSFLEWFLSGGDNYQGGIRYLMVLICFLTLFFAMVVFYYAIVHYRTSSLLLISMIAFLVHVKLVREVEIIQVMAVVILNVTAFLMNNRKKRDEDKRKVGKVNGILSIALYSVVFVLIAFAVPMSTETKYYSEFEDRFLGGNSQVEVPSDYLDSSKFSGNADNMQSLNTRKLYAISGLPRPMVIYLHRTTFDYYDYKENHWVIYDENYNRGKKYEEWVDGYKDYDLNQEKLVEAINMAYEYEPQYMIINGLKAPFHDMISDKKYKAHIRTYNLATEMYVVPIKGKVYEDKKNEQDNIFITVNGDYMSYTDRLSPYNEYDVEFYYDFEIYDEWIENGFSNYSLEESLELLQAASMTLYEYGEDEYEEVISDYCAATNLAIIYQENYEKENDIIPAEVKKLAMEITKDCTYDWEKAEALRQYFNQGFRYQLGYKAPDDSVEYFLFESKTGTCSDFASAYVLMARAVGLCARYVEGYATDNNVETMEGETELIVRASDAHAYAEVFIANYGYAIFDPTLGEVMESLIPEEEIPTNTIVVGYVLTLGARIVIIFAGVSVLLLAVILIIKVIKPRIKEYRFIRRVKKTTLGEGAVMLYLKLLERCPLVAENVKSKTPYEFVKAFKEKTGYDISMLVNIVEEYKYKEKKMDVLFKDSGEDVLLVYKTAVKEYKKVCRRTKN